MRPPGTKERRQEREASTPAVPTKRGGKGSPARGAAGRRMRLADPREQRAPTGGTPEDRLRPSSRGRRWIGRRRGGSAPPEHRAAGLRPTQRDGANARGGRGPPPQTGRAIQAEKKKNPAGGKNDSNERGRQGQAAKRAPGGRCDAKRGGDGLVGRNRTAGHPRARAAKTRKPARAPQV